MRRTSSLSSQRERTRRLPLLTARVLIEERDRILDRLPLHGVRRVFPVGVPLHVDEAMHVVLVALPVSVLAELRKEVVADAEDALQLVAVASLHENRRRDRVHPLAGDLLGDARTDLCGLAHQ